MKSLPDHGGRWAQRTALVLLAAAPGANTRASVDSDENQGNSPSYNSSVSADGNYVAFVSDDTNGLPAAFVRDLRAGATGAEDPAGNALAQDEVWTFTTGKK